MEKAYTEQNGNILYGKKMGSLRRQLHKRRNRKCI